MGENEVTSSAKNVPPLDSVFEERAVQRDNEDFSKARNRLFYGAILLAVFILSALYLLSPDSRVKAISVNGTDYLSHAYITKLAGVKINALFYAQFPKAIEARIEEDPFIETADVTLLHDNIIEISVTEKQPIGCRYDEDVPTLLFTDGSICNLTSDYMPVLSRVPFITGFNEENQTHLLTTGFREVKKEMIEEMAEVMQYPLSYDPDAIEIRMRDGIIFFSDYFSLGLLNDYPKISSLMTNKNNCLYADNGTSVAASRACPWDEVPVEYEYWTDEDGNFIYNKWGDKAVKHYYYNKNAGYYLDDNGEKILIPIDAYGQDQTDPDFLNHYFLGYYKNGYLEIPEETEEEETGEETESGEESTDAEETADAQEGSEPQENTNG